MSLELTPEDMADKIRQSKAVGLPVFMTEAELRWLAQLLLQFADEFNESNSSLLDRLDFSYAVSVGVKCARELERNQNSSPLD